MISARRRIATVVLPIAVTMACSDTTNPAAAAHDSAIAPPQTSAQYTEYGPQSAPAGVGAEWTLATSITVEAAAGFRDEGVSPDEGVAGNARSFAWGQAIVRYFANEADARVDLTARKNGSVVASAQAEKNDRFFFPANRSMSAITQAYVPAGCGHTAQARAFGQAWNRVIIPPLSWFEWGRKGGDNTESGYQSPCESGSPPSSGGGTVEVPATDGGRCPWHRDFIVFPDGSWRWLTSWYRSCVEYELGVAHGRPTDVTNPMASSTSGRGSGGPMQLTIIGVPSRPNGAVVTIERNGKGSSDATIILDMARATAGDLEEAFVAAEALSVKVKPKDAKSAYGQIIAGTSETSRAAAVAGSRAATNFDALLRAADARGKSGGEVSIEVVVNRK